VDKRPISFFLCVCVCVSVFSVDLGWLHDWRPNGSLRVRSEQQRSKRWSFKTRIFRAVSDGQNKKSKRVFYQLKNMSRSPPTARLTTPAHRGRLWFVHNGQGWALKPRPCEPTPDRSIRMLYVQLCTWDVCRHGCSPAGVYLHRQRDWLVSVLAFARYVIDRKAGTALPFHQRVMDLHNDQISRKIKVFLFGGMVLVSARWHTRPNNEGDGGRLINVR